MSNVRSNSRNKSGKPVAIWLIPNVFLAAWVVSRNFWMRRLCFQVCRQGCVFEMKELLSFFETGRELDEKLAAARHSSRTYSLLTRQDTCRVMRMRKWFLEGIEQLDSCVAEYMKRGFFGACCEGAFSWIGGVARYAAGMRSFVVSCVFFSCM